MKKITFLFLLSLIISHAIFCQDLPQESPWKHMLTERLAGHAENIYRIAYSPTSRIIAVNGYSKIMLMDSVRGYVAKVLENDPSTHFTGLTYHPLHDLIAVGTHNGSILLWASDPDADDTSFQKKDTLAVDNHHGVRNLVFSHDGKTLLTCFDKTVKLFDAHTNQESARFDFPEANFLRNRINDCALHPTDPILAVAFGRVIKLVDTRTSQEIATIPFSDSCFWKIRFHPNGKMLATCATQVDLRSFEGSYPVYKRFETNLNMGTKVAFSIDGETLAFTQDKTIKIWDINSQKESSPELKHDSNIRALTFSPDNTQLAVAHGNKVSIWQDPMTIRCDDND